MMQRRAFVLASLAAASLAAGCGGGGEEGPVESDSAEADGRDPLGRKKKKPAATPTTGTAIDPIAEVQKLRLNSGPYEGAYVIAPDGMVMWYFSHLAVWPLVHHMSGADLDKYVRTYLDCYLSKLKDNKSIDDCDPSDNYRLIPSDSDDSYAALFFTIALRYVQASGNTQWLVRNKQTLIEMAENNIVQQIKANNLTSCFQPPRRQTVDDTGYIMDNAEVYRGLRDIAAIMSMLGDANQAAYFDAAAERVGAGINALWHEPMQGFRSGDDYKKPLTNFYMGTTCQIFMQVFGVDVASHRFDAAWAYLNKHTPQWWTGQYDPYPWNMVAYCAAKRGESANAQKHLAMCDGRFANRKQRPKVMINELGWYMRTRSLLAGQPDV